MKALSSFKIDTLVESRYFAIALNGLLILAISVWLLNQWLPKEINSSAPLLMPTAHNIQPQGQPDRSGAVNIKQIIYQDGQLQVFISTAESEMIEALRVQLMSNADQVEIDQFDISDGIASARIRLYE